MDESRYRRAEAALWESVGTIPRERRVHLGRNGVEVRVQEVGDGPAVLFVHGASTCGSSWATLAGRLPDFRCLLLDRPGCGLSDPLDGVLEPDRLERFGDTLVADVLDALGLDSAHLVGTSFGGYLTLRSAAAYPDRVGRMVQCSWPVGAPLERLPAFMRMMGAPVLGRLAAAVPVNERSVRMMFRRLGHGESLEAGRIGQENIDWFLALLRHTDTMHNEVAVGRGFFSLLKGLKVTLSDNTLAAIRTPTLFLWGEKDPFGGPDTARALVAHMRDAELDLRPGAGHAPWLDDVDHAASSTTAFLGR